MSLQRSLYLQSLPLQGNYYSYKLFHQNFSARNVSIFVHRNSFCLINFALIVHFNDNENSLSSSLILSV